MPRGTRRVHAAKRRSIPGNADLHRQRVRDERGAAVLSGTPIRRHVCWIMEGLPLLSVVAASSDPSAGASALTKSNDGPAGNPHSNESLGGRGTVICCRNSRISLPGHPLSQPQERRLTAPCSCGTIDLLSFVGLTQRMRKGIRSRHGGLGADRLRHSRVV